MEIKTESTKTYYLSMTETQARDLLSVAVVHSDEFTESEEETLNTIRQVLLSAGLKRNET